MKVVGMSRAQTRNWLPRLCPRGGVFGMRMGHAANAGKRIVQDEMRRQIRGRAQIPFENPAVEIGSHQVLRTKLVVRHSARLDDHYAIFARDAADISKCK